MVKNNEDFKGNDLVFIVRNTNIAFLAHLG